MMRILARKQVRPFSETSSWATRGEGRSVEGGGAWRRQVLDTIFCSSATVHITCITILLIELAVVGQTLIFSVSQLSQNSTIYDTNNAALRVILHYDYYFPLTVIEILWLCTNILGVIGVKFVRPYLFLPHIVVSLLVFVGVIVIVSITVVQIVNAQLPIIWPIVLFVSLLALFVLVESYFSAVKVACFKTLVKRKKASESGGEDFSQSVRGFVDKGNSIGATTAATVTRDEPSKSFSRRSTMVITDDHLVLPLGSSA